MDNIAARQNIVQIAYYVSDIKAAAKKTYDMFGYGPFYLYENIKLTNVNYRGQAAELDHSSAYGQAGDIMIEFAQQNNSGPSAFRDMYAEGEEGMHHVALFVANVEAEIQRYEKSGFSLAAHYFAPGNVEVAFIDTTKEFGHMLELYAPNKALKKFYSMVAASSDDWNGKELFIKI